MKINNVIIIKKKKFLTNEQQKSMKMHKSVISVKKNLKDKKIVQ